MRSSLSATRNTTSMTTTGPRPVHSRIWQRRQSGTGIMATKRPRRSSVAWPASAAETDTAWLYLERVMLRPLEPIPTARSTASTTGQ